MNEREIQALSNMIIYLRDEEEDYENANPKQKKFHIYNDIQVLKEFLRKEKEQKQK